MGWWLVLVGCAGSPPPGAPSVLPVVTADLSPARVCPASTRGPWRRRVLPAVPLPSEAELHSGGLAVADLDDDGALDLFLPHFSTSALLLGLGDGDFVDATARLAGLDLADAVGAAVADVEGDGDLDLFVTRWRRPNVLLANDGAGGFVDVTSRAGLGGTTDRHQSATFADVDRDGDLDLFVGSYGAQPSDDFSFDDPDLPPSTDRKYLYLNDGAGGFVERSELLPDDVQRGYTFSSTWLDIDGDTFPELFVWNDFGTAHPSRLLVNGGGRAWTDEPGTTGIDRAFEDMGVAVGDLDRDGLPDFATTSYRRMGLLLSSPAANGAGAVWLDAAAARGLDVVADQEFGWGAAFGDLDHDRDEDLVASFGYWSRYPGTPLRQPDGVWVQGEDGTFTQRAREWGLDDPGVGRGILLADLDGDGFLDLVKRNLDRPAEIVGSSCDGSAWVSVALRQASADTRALGARVVAVSADGTRQTRWVLAGGSSMYSGGPPTVHFGLGADEEVTLEVTWPDGRASTTTGVPTRRPVTLTRW
jgi:hypothetical protein